MITIDTSTAQANTVRACIRIYHDLLPGFQLIRNTEYHQFYNIEVL